MFPSLDPSNFDPKSCFSQGTPRTHVVKKCVARVHLWWREQSFKQEN